MTSKKSIGKIWRGIVFPFVMPLLFRIPFMKHFFFKLTSQIKLNYRHSPLSQGRAGKIHAGDRLPWVQYETTDNYASLQSMDWQVHIYGTANATLTNKLNLTLHVFPWHTNVESTGLEKNTLYLIRPDGYIAYINRDQNPLLLKDFLFEVKQQRKT
jgi:hypothetical protein